MTTLSSDADNVTSGLRTERQGGNPGPRVVRDAALDWVKFDARIARDGSIDPVDKALYAALASFVDSQDRDTNPDPDGLDVPTRAALAACIGRSVDTVDRATRRLEELGVLRVERRRDPKNPRSHLPSVYALLDHEWWDDRAAVRAAARRAEKRGGNRMDAATPSRMDAATPSRTGAAVPLPVEKEKKREEKNSPPTPPADTTAGAQPGHEEEGREERITPPIPLNDNPRTLVAAVAADWNLTARDVRSRAEKAVAAALAAGKTWEQIAARVTGREIPVGDDGKPLPPAAVGRLMAWRLENLDHPALNAPSPKASTEEAALVLDGEMAEYREHAAQALRWWTESHGTYIARGQRANLLSMLADAFEQGVQPQEIKSALLAFGDSCPLEWQFQKVVGMIRDGQSPELAREFVTGGFRLTPAMAKREEARRTEAAWDRKATIFTAFEEAGVGSLVHLNFFKAPERAEELWTMAEAAGIDNPVQDLDEATVERLRVALASFDDEPWIIERNRFVRERFGQLAADPAFDVEVTPHRTIRGELAM